MGNWFIQISATLFDLRSVYFIDANIGWAVGSSGIIRTTTDGGTNWLCPSSGTIKDLRSVYFVDATTGWAVGSSGTILMTTDGGASWLSQSSGTSETMRSAFFTDAATGWAAGEGGAILKTTTGGITSVEQSHQLTNSIPNQIVLMQNYPNPFNPSTSIRFNLAESSFVTLKVFNLLGESVETLINGKRSAGKYEVKWSMEDLPSGVYFYQLRAGAFSQVKKMTLLH